MKHILNTSQVTSALHKAQKVVRINVVRELQRNEVPPTTVVSEPIRDYYI